MTVPSVSGQLSLDLPRRERRQRTDSTRDVCALIDADPLHARDRQAVVDAIRAVAHLPEISRNDVAPLVPSWVFPKVIGTTFNVLRARHVLEPTGRHVWSTDKRGRNGNKLAPTYTVHLDRLEQR